MMRAAYDPRAAAPARHEARWERHAPWVAPLLTVALVAVAMLVMFTSHGSVA